MSSKKGSSSAQAAEEEAYLPRGGSGGKAGAGRRDTAGTKDEDALFSSASSKPSAKKTKPSSPANKRDKKRARDDAMDVDTDPNNSDDDSDDIEKKLPDISKPPSRVEYLRYSSLTEGMVLLGCIKEINEFDIAVSLPCNLKGYVKITEISDTYLKRLEKEIARQQSGIDDDSTSAIAGLSDFFYLGQYVRCMIVRLDDAKDGKRIELSMRESLLNRRSPLSTLRPGQIVTGSIASSEDHGYVVSLGIKGANGFLLKKNATGRAPASAALPDAPLVEGQPVDLLVTSVNQATKTVYVDASYEKIASTMTKPDDVAIIDNVRPGMLVKVSVSAVISGGLWVRFLDYFGGVVGLLHLDKVVADGLDGLKKAYKVGQKLKARVLYVDYESKHIGLTLQTHAVKLAPFAGEKAAEIGTIFDDATVARVDAGVGLVVALPTDPAVSGYVHVSRVGDVEVDNLDKKFKVGQTVKCRVLNYSHVDGLANLTMKQSQIDEPFLRYEDLEVGSVVTGKISAVHSKGLEVKLASTIKAFCPRIHLADAAVSDPESRFKVGSEVPCRVLAVDAAARRATVTLKKSLVNTSDIDMLSSYADASRDLITRGFIIAVKDFGCIVGFLNNVRGKVPLKELSTSYVSDPSKLFQVGQVVKCRVVSADPAKEKLTLSFNLAKSKSEAETEQLQKAIDDFAAESRVVKAEITAISTRGVDVKLTKELSGFIPLIHLSDHRANTALVKKHLKVGQSVEALVVKKGKAKEAKKVTLSMKPALVAAYKEGQVPTSFSDVSKGSTYVGFVKKILPYGVFVSFVDGVTGLAHKNGLADQFVQNPEDFFYVGQTVYALVIDVNPERHEFSVSLKPSVASSKQTSFLETYISEAERFGKRKENVDWSKYQVGTVLNLTTVRQADYGLLLEVSDSSKLPCVAVSQHVPSSLSVEAGNSTKGVVLDVDAAKGILDVSLRPDLVRAASAASSQSASKLLREGQSITCTVELIKGNYVVLSQTNADGKGVRFAYGPTRDFNSAAYAKSFQDSSLLQRVKCTVNKVRKGQAVTYLVTMESGDAKDSNSDSSGSRVNSVSDLKVGLTVSCKITAIKDAHMAVSIGPHVKGRIHITEVVDDISREHPFAKFKVGDVIQDAKVISLQERTAENTLEITHQTAAKNVTVDLSLRPSCVQMPAGSIGTERFSWTNCKKGQQVNGWVHQVTADALWVHISPAVRGRVFILDVSNDLNILRNLSEHFRPGQGVKLKILRVDPEKQDLDLSIKALFQEKNAAASPQELKAGMIIPGRIARVLLNRGLYLQLFSHTYGRAFITDLADDLVADPLSSYAERIGEVVECYVLGVNERQDGLIDLSLRSSRISRLPASKSNEVVDFKSILPGTTVRGYVKNVNVSNKTCFISLNRNIVARVFFKNLSDKFVKDPVASFPIGKLVEGRIISVDAKSQRVEMTLRKQEVKEKRTFAEISIGEKVKGYIKRIEKFGIFVNIKDASVVGLCHVSEVLDEKTNLSEDDLKRMFSPGDYVKAIVLRKNDEKKQLSLSFKPSHFENDENSEEEDDDEAVADASASGSDEAGSDDASENSDAMDVDEESDSDDDNLVAPDGSRVFLPDDASSDDDLPVVSDEELDEEPDSDDEEEPEPVNSKKRKHSDQADESKPKKRKLEEEAVLAQLELPKPSLSGKPASTARDEPASPVKRVGTLVSDVDEAALQDLASLDSEEDDSEEDQADLKRQLDSDGSDDEAAREREVEQRERQLLDADAPETPQDFERLLLSEPNNSMLWIRYMAHWLSQNEIAKARETAEKALQRINIREQKEKRNVWIALMNLEHNYGTKESLGGVFKRAAAHNDTKDIHLELIKIYNRAKEFKAADEIYQTLIRRFKQSKAVWISYGTFKFQQGELDEARALLDRALKSLPRRKHLAVISKFAQLEFKNGSPERGRTIFENILATYPKRVDIWSIYLDMEMRMELRDKIRNLFDRAVSLNLSSKKMKFFFKRYLNFEKQYGTPETVEMVKQKAQDYVAKKTSAD